MAGSDILVDTNVVVAFLAREAATVRRLDEVGRIFIPVIVAGELLYGAEASARRESNRRTVEDLLAQHVVLTCDAGTARQYAAIKHRLRLKGRPIPDNDIWVAALAMQHGLALATRDGHFQEVEGLSIEEC